MASKFFQYSIPTPTTSSNQDLCAEKVLKRLREALSRSDHKCKFGDVVFELWSL